MDENNQNNLNGDNFFNNMNNNPQNEPNNGTFQNNTMPNNNVNESFTNQNQSINMSDNTYNPNNNNYNQALNNNMNNNSFNANTGNTYPNNVNNTINTNNTNINTNQQFNTNNMNQNIPNKSKKSKLPLIIILIVVLLIIIVAAIVLISKDKNNKVDDVSEKRTSSGTYEAVSEKNEDKKEKNSSKEKLWVKTLDWDNIPEKENDLVLYSTFKAPISIETFEKYATDAHFSRYEGEVTGIAISPDELATSEEVVSHGYISFCEKADLDFNLKKYDREEADKRMALKDILASEKYWLGTSSNFKSLLGLESYENSESGESKLFKFMLERYGRPSKVAYYEKLESMSEFIWKRDGYYFSIAYLDTYNGGDNLFSSYMFSYVPENSWEDKMKADSKYIIRDFDEYIGGKSKVKKITGDDSKNYIKESEPLDNIAIFNEINYKDQNFRYRKYGNEYNIVEYLGNDKEIIIPNEVNGLEVKNFNLYVPTFVEKMYVSGHFENMSLNAPELKEIVFDENTVVDNLDITEFVDCDSLENYYFPKCKTLSGNINDILFMRLDGEPINIYFNSVEDLEDFEVVEAVEGNKFIFHVKDNPKLYKMLKEKGYTVYED